MMRKLFTFLCAALMSVGMFALTPLSGDTWDDATKTLTVNSNPGYRAYRQKTEIVHVIISSSVTSIGESAFASCSGLTSITIPSSVTSIGQTAFASCTGLISLTIGSGVKSMGGGAFTDCTGLTSVTIGNGVESIGSNAFSGCTSLTSITIPNSVTSIGYYAFDSCTGLISVTIGSGVTSIGSYAFIDCSNITDVYCYPDAANLTWNDSGGDNFKESKATRCHVHADQLSAYNSKFTATVNVTFVGDLPATVAVTGVTLNQNEAAMTVGGETLTLTATVNPNNATDQSVSWSTSDANVATVENGVVTAVAAGTATITVTTTDGSYTATCDVTVTAPAPTDFAITANEDPQNTGTYYSTFYHGAADYTLPEGVEAYKAALSGDALNLTSVAVSGQSIPAGNAVILKSNVQNYTLAVSALTSSTFDGNSLQGTDDAISTPADCYVLSGTNTEGVGFYQYTGDNLNPHKAYVIYNGGAGAPRRMRFVFETEQTATDLEEINTTSNAYKIIRDGQLIIIRNGVEYNVNGQEVK